MDRWSPWWRLEKDRVEGWKRGVGVAQGGKEDSEEVSQVSSWGGKGSSDDISEGDYEDEGGCLK